MAAIKSHQAASFLKNPERRFTAFLFYGPDAGLASERARDLAKLLAARESPPGEVIRIDEADLDGDPDRLAVELRTLPMFGGQQIVRTAAGRRINAALLKPLVEDGDLAGRLVVEAGNLRPDEALRGLFEKCPHAAAIACYPDEAQDLDALIRSILGAAGQTMAPEARDLLAARLGADHALSRAEIEKLSLYAAGRKVVETEDVEAVVGDASELQLDRAPQAAASGDGVRAVRECERLVSSGENAQGVIAATHRYLHRLHRLRALVEQGRSFDDAARTIRPPLHFRQKDVLAGQCRQWTLANLTRAVGAAAEAQKAARLAGPLEEAVAQRLLLEVARLARSPLATARR
jgi:DNA polymerase-3 subunit delta